MVEHNEAVVKANAAIGQFEVIHRAPRKFRFDKILQIVTPVAETAAERKRQINFLEQFVARHQTIKRVPRIAELDVAARLFGFRPPLAT